MDGKEISKIVFRPNFFKIGRLFGQMLTQIFVTIWHHYCCDITQDIILLYSQHSDCWCPGTIYLLGYLQAHWLPKLGCVNLQNCYLKPLIIIAIQCNIRCSKTNPSERRIAEVGEVLVEICIWLKGILWREAGFIIKILTHNLPTMFCHQWFRQWVGICLCQDVTLICLFYTYYHLAWWRHQMETFSALLVLCVGN